MFKQIHITHMNGILHGLLQLILISPVSLQVVKEQISTVAYRGTTTNITCPGQVVFTLPRWSGPPVLPDGKDTVYTLDGDANPNPALPRISYAYDKRTLILTNTSLSDAGTYRCFKQNAAFIGDNNVSVLIRPDQPEITASVPVDNIGVRATEGQSMTITCTSRGGYPVHTVALYWGSIAGQPVVQKNSGTLVGDTYTVTLPYTFTPSRQHDRQQLVCRSYWPTPTEAQGSLVETVFMYMYLKPVQPNVTQTTDGVAGNDVTVQCRTSGCRPAANISWAYQGQTYTPNVTVTTNDTATQTFTIVSMLRMPVIAADNGQMVLCRVSHRALGGELTASAILNVQFPVGPSTTTITGNRVTVANGINKLPLVCTSGSSNPPVNITWKKGTDVITNEIAYNNTTGENNGVIISQTLLITPTRNDHGDSISCFATNGVNQFTDNTTVTLTLLYSPIVTISTSSITLTEQPSQSPTILPCTADSNPPATIRWYHNGQDVTPEGADNSLSFTIREASRASYGNYTCTADNNVQPGDSKTYTVKVLFPPLEVSINTSPKTVIANGQNPMLISCTSGTSNPVSEITWNTGSIQTDTPSHVDSPGGHGGTVLTSTIRFNPTREHDGATVRCEARNSVTGQHEVSNSTLIDNIIYPPLIADIPARNVTEGDSVTLSCKASSKPPASFTWKSNGSAEVTNGLGEDPHYGPNYTIHNTSRTQAGTYICTADNQVHPSDNKQMLLTVLYPPDITVLAINKTVNSSETTVTCEASGVPDQYFYESWVHTWNGHVVTHPRLLPATRVLTLTNLSYAHSGVYMCGARNGVKGVSYGAGSLLVKSPPIVVGDVANRMEIKASGQLMKAITVTIQFYSNAGRGSVTVKKTSRTAEEVGDVQLRDVNIKLPVFLSKINTSGTEATINITVTDMSQFGGYDVFVVNDMGRVQLSLIIQPLGPPETPELINSTVLNHQSVTVVWISGFPNGLNQTFVIQLSTDKITWGNTTIYGGMAYQQTHSKRIDNLASNQLYFVRMLAFNVEGASELSSILSFITAAPPDPPISSPIGVISGGAAGGVVAAAIVSLVIIVVVRRRKAARLSGSAKDKGALVMSSTHNEGYNNGDEEVINRLYESAGVTETAVCTSTSEQVPPADAENIYAKVKKKPEVVYAMPDKRKGKKMERQQNQKTFKSQKVGKKKEEKHDNNKKQTGDVYENAPSIMSSNKFAPQSKESVYEDTSISATAEPKKPTGADGLLYADLEFAPKRKGPPKIIGIEDRCEYTTIDLTKKAQPLPDSDDEDKTNT